MPEIKETAFRKTSEFAVGDQIGKLGHRLCMTEENLLWNNRIKHIVEA